MGMDFNIDGEISGMGNEQTSSHFAREAVEVALKESLERAGVDADVYRDKSMPQSELFMVELIPRIHKLFEHLPINAEITVLDVGPQTFSGTALLSRLHSKKTFNQLKMKVTAVDIHEKFLSVKDLICPEVDFIKSDVLNLDPTKQTWDLIIASHVVEHVQEPNVFLRQLQVLSNYKVLVATPWDENPITTAGHLNTVNKELIRKVSAKNLEIFTNFSWGKNREVCVFELDGLARAD